MSTLAYAAITTSREKGEPGTTQLPPGVKTWVDALAALVPAEVLSLHAVILSVTTEKLGQDAIKIADPLTLKWAALGLVMLSVILYVVPRLLYGSWDGLDYIRSAIPPLAFIGWTMLQKATAFDAVFPGLEQAPRTVIALFLAVLLGLLASSLGYKADQKKVSGKPPKKH